MEYLCQKLDEILKFFTTETITGLPHVVGKFTCIPLMLPSRVHAGYLVVKGSEMHFFPAASLNDIVSNENAAVGIESLIEEQWLAKTALCLN